MLTPSTLALAVLPALSATVKVCDCPAPSLLNGCVPFAGEPELSPDSASLAAYSAVTFALFQPRPLASDPTARPALITGAVLSRLMPESVLEAVLPATSAAVKVTDRLAPSSLTVWFATAPLIPERASEALAATSTSALYQPAAFGLVTAAGDRAGAVLSMLMPEKVSLLSLPAASVHLPFTDWLAAALAFSVETVVGAGSAAPEPASVQVKLTRTLLFVHAPAAYGRVLAASTSTTALLAIPGAVLSIL